MHVIKRNGNKEPVRFDKITYRLQRLSGDLNVDVTRITQKLCVSIVTGISTIQLDTLSAQIAASLGIEHIDYMSLAARIAISNHQKNTPNTLAQCVQRLFNHSDENGDPTPLVSKNYHDIVMSNSSFLEKYLEHERDYLLDFFGFKTLERSYLIKIRQGTNIEVVERPQYLFMRVAIGIWGDDMSNVIKTYDNLSLKNYTHATPTLFNAGTPTSQLASCYLSMAEDSIEGIFESYKECGIISKWAGGVGCDISAIRPRGSYIRSTGGVSDGIVPLLKSYNCIARQFNQGGKRLGSFAMYLNVHHPDVFDFLNAKKNQGADDERARDLFYALWIPDLFMRKINDQTEDGEWYLMDPDKSPGLQEVYGEEFDLLYNKYVSEGKYVKKIKARELWTAILQAQVELGMPYMLYKDACNKKSNQKNIGVIRSSNLCAEIVEVASKEEIAVCNLASVCLPKILRTYPHDDSQDKVDVSFHIYSTTDCGYCKLLKAVLEQYGIPYVEITKETSEEFITLLNLKKPETVPQVFYSSKTKGVKQFVGGFTETWKLVRPRLDYNKLRDITYQLVLNLNKVIDTTYYPVEKTKLSNLRHRPIGIGVQGLADVFMQLKIPFDCDEARDINKKIFETMYYGAMQASLDLAKVDGAYETFKGSPLSEGKFQYNLWGVKETCLSGMWDFEKLREEVMQYGTRNSLLIALMPTASTSQIMGSVVECFEPLSSNMYVRRTLAGEFTVINPFLIKDLMSLGIWNEKTRNILQYDRGSVQNIPLPDFLKRTYRTVYEISQRSLIEMSADRAPFVCQSQSLNLFFNKPQFNQLSAAHFLGWRLGLKTGSYYIRTNPAMNSQRFGMDVSVEKEIEECLTCSA